MAKVKTVFFCQNCGSQSPKWIGRCPNCNEWNTYVEERVDTSREKAQWQAGKPVASRNGRPKRLADIAVTEEQRLATGDKELDRVLGGGLVKGSVVLMSGEPGIGKSTLLLQLALRLRNRNVLYVSGEESEQQIRMRAARLDDSARDCLILSEASADAVFTVLKDLQPDLVIIDSIQTMYLSHVESSPGSVSQVRECTAEFLRYAKETATPVVLVGHITKDGMIAGPKVLEHMVDAVLQFEGDVRHVYRILRPLKNRFGSTSELGIYQMVAEGLKEVANPSEVLLAHRQGGFSGIAIAAALEGIRPMLIETQALVSTAVYGTPQRSVTGFDLRRLNMLLAVLEKRCGFRLGSKDVFLNLAGGIRMEDPALDLAVACAVLSSSEDVPLPAGVCFAAEIGLSGEIRPVARLEQRIGEAARLGFDTIYVSSFGAEALLKKGGQAIRVVPVSKVDTAFSQLLG
jgi:DNA repair protein RadA/Sms